MSVLVYSAQPADVDTVLVDGDLVMREGKLLAIDQQQVTEDATREALLLMARAGLSQVSDKLED
jgi:cytosine/adenosine deaminase-related metal-dependent hydrolase